MGSTLNGGAHLLFLKMYAMKTSGLSYAIFIFLLAGTLHAQDYSRGSQDVQDEGFSYVLTDLNYISDAIFMGRRDSISAPYLYPSIGYYDKSGFFANASASYLTRSDENRVDLFLLSTGFVFDDDTWSGGISGSLYFFNDESYNVKSETVGDLTGNLGYDLGPVQTGISLSTYFNDGSSVDFFTGWHVSKEIISSDNAWLIIPQFSVYGGTQQFYEAYYQTSRLGNRKGQGMGSGGSVPMGEQALEIQESEKFKLLNLEIGVPIHFYHKQFIFSVNPMLAFPQNPATIELEDTTISEELDTVFYGYVGISYWFKT